MILFGYSITVPLVFTVFLHVAGGWILYANRKDLLYDDEDKNANTQETLSMGRCWSWLLFYIAFSFWLRYVMGEISANTPFPPGLQEMLYACLLYEFAKKGIDVSAILMRNRRTGSGFGGGSYGGYPGGEYGGSPYDSSPMPPPITPCPPPDVPMQSPPQEEQGPPHKGE